MWNSISRPVYVFAFRCPRRGDLYFPDGGCFHRVVRRGGGYFYLRAQPTLPEGAVGSLYQVDGRDRRLLEALAETHRLPLILHDNPGTCLAQAGDLCRGVLIYGVRAPAGVLTGEGLALFDGD
jgi:hypothetical protein